MGGRLSSAEGSSSGLGLQRHVHGAGYADGRRPAADGTVLRNWPAGQQLAGEKRCCRRSGVAAGCISKVVPAPGSSAACDPPGTQTAYSTGYISSLVGHSVFKVHRPDCRQSAQTRRSWCACAAWRRVEMRLNLSCIFGWPGRVAPAGWLQPGQLSFGGFLTASQPARPSSWQA